MQKLLDRLEKVKQTGTDRWIACCPAHNDKNPSLTVSHKGNRTLVHCHSGCSFHDIAAAVGLEASDFFDDPMPWQMNEYNYGERKKAKALAHEIERAISYLHIAQNSVDQGIKMTVREMEKVKKYHALLVETGMLGAEPWWK